MDAISSEPHKGPLKNHSSHFEDKEMKTQRVSNLSVFGK